MLFPKRPKTYLSFKEGFATLVPELQAVVSRHMVWESNPVVCKSSRGSWSLLSRVIASSREPDPVPALELATQAR